MADVTVKELADVVKTSVDNLLVQMKEAGLKQTAADQAVSEEEKQTLLLHLKKSHGATASTKKITLQRKETSTLKTGQGGKKSVRSEEHTSELQSRPHLVCRLLLEKKK